jgi:hypothetical protein
MKNNIALINIGKYAHGRYLKYRERHSCQCLPFHNARGPSRCTYTNFPCTTMMVHISLQKKNSCFLTRSLLL